MLRYRSSTMHATALVHDSGLVMTEAGDDASGNALLLAPTRGPARRTAPPRSTSTCRWLASYSSRAGHSTMRRPRDASCVTVRRQSIGVRSRRRSAR